MIFPASRRTIVCNSGREHTLDLQFPPPPAIPQIRFGIFSRVKNQFIDEAGFAAD